MPTGKPGTNSGVCRNHPDKVAECKGLCGNCYKKEWLKKNPDKDLKHRRRNNKKCVRCEKRKPHSEFPDIQRTVAGGRLAWNRICNECSDPKNVELNKELRRQAYRLRRHRLSREQYETILKEQGGVCAICQKSAKLYVDHDHSCCPKADSCGKCVRGLLCSLCNSGIGKLEDSPERLQRAVEYLCKGLKKFGESRKSSAMTAIAGSS